jgi:hypothetical protein
VRVAILLVALLANALAAASDQPSIGGDVVEQRVVDLPTSPPGDCLSIPVERFSLLISTNRMLALARARPEKWCTESERLALIAGNRADALLSMARGSVDRFGCQELVPPIAEDVKYLMVSELEDGAAVVADPRSGVIHKRAELHFTSYRCGPLCGAGYLFVRTVEGELLWSVNWWVS